MSAQVIPFKPGSGRPRGRLADPVAKWVPVLATVAEQGPTKTRSLAAASVVRMLLRAGYLDREAGQPGVVFVTPDGLEALELAEAQLREALELLE